MLLVRWGEQVSTVNSGTASEAASLCELCEALGLSDVGSVLLVIGALHCVVPCCLVVPSEDEEVDDERLSSGTEVLLLHFGEAL